MDNSYFNPKNSFKAVYYNRVTPLLSCEINELQQIVSEKIGGFIKDSGVTGVLSTPTYVINGGKLTLTSEVKAYLDGERLFIPYGTQIDVSGLADGDTAILFIESWNEVATKDTALTEYGGEGQAPVTNNIKPSYSYENNNVSTRIVNKWRLRLEKINTGVTYITSTPKFPYLGYSSSSVFSPIYVKGANSGLAKPTSVTGTEVFRPANGSYKTYSEDVNLWVGGDTTDACKTTYKTDTGIVLAMPLFRLTMTSSVIKAQAEGTSEGVRKLNEQVADLYAKKLDATANAVSATKLQTARTFALSGGVSGSGSFDGTGNVNIAVTVADDSHKHTSLNRVDLTGSTVDINTLNLSDGTVSKFYMSKTSGGSANITNIPVAGNAFILDVELMRYASSTDYITRQTFTDTSTTTTYIRFCTSGAWGSWREVYTTAHKPNYSDVGAMSYQSSSTATDLNTLTSTGIFDLKVASNPNAPTTSNGRVICNYNVGTPYQLWIPDNTFTVYKRTFASSAWGAWTNVVSASNIGLGNVTNESKATMFTNPVFTGTPLAPTAGAGTNTTQLATTAFVCTAIANLVNGSQATLDTLKELADALGNDPNFATTIANQMGLKAPLASPVFTGLLTAMDVQVDGKLSFKASGDNTDYMYITKNDIASDISELNVCIGDNGSGNSIPQPTTGSTDYVAFTTTNGDVHHLFGSDGSYKAGGNISAPTVSATAPNGTAPLAVTSKTKVQNLNADLFDDLEASAFYQRYDNRVETGSDWNTFCSAGTYKVQNFSTSDSGAPPATYLYGLLLVDRAGVDDESRITQTYIPHTIDKNIYFRVSNKSVWTGWKVIPVSTEGRTVWHSENDGAGSGLDADKLQGKDPTDFAPSGYGLGGLGKRLSNGADLNTVKASGWYDVQNPVNAPYSSGWFNLLVCCSGDAGYVTQIGFGMTVNIGSTYIRTLTNGAWSSWATLYSTAVKPSASDVGLDSMSSDITFSDSGTSFRGVKGAMAGSDGWRIGGAGTGSNAGYLEIATTDDGNEPIYVRQYSDGKGVYGFSTLARTLTLLDALGNTVLPGSLTVAGKINIPAIAGSTFLQGTNSGGVSRMDSYLNIYMESNFGAWSVNSTDSSSTSRKALAVYGYGSSTPNKVTTLSNTLDDGAGGMNVAGITVINTTPDSIGKILQVRDSSATSSNETFGGVYIGSMPGTDYIIGKHNKLGTSTLEVRTDGGAKLLSLLGSNGALTTKNGNVLDDGSGNVSLAGAVTVADVNHYLVNFSGSPTWGIYWNTTGNTIEFHNSGTAKASVDLDDGKITTSGDVVVGGSVQIASKYSIQYNSSEDSLDFIYG